MTNAFCWLYISHTQESLEKYPNFFRLYGVDKEVLINNFLASPPVFESYETFLSFCEKDNSDDK